MGNWNFGQLKLWYNVYLPIWGIWSQCLCTSIRPSWIAILKGGRPYWNVIRLGSFFLPFSRQYLISWREERIEIWPTTNKRICVAYYVYTSRCQSFSLWRLGRSWHSSTSRRIIDVYSRVTRGFFIEILQIEETSHRPLCEWQRQSGNSLRAKKSRWEVFVFVYAYRVRERQPIPPYHSLSLTRADRFQTGLSPLSIISL